MKLIATFISLALCAGTLSCNPLDPVNEFVDNTINQVQRLSSDAKEFVHKQPFIASLTIHASALAFSRVRTLAFGVKATRTIFKTLIGIIGIGVSVPTASIAIDKATA